MLMFLAVEFLFYLWNTLGEVLHGYGLFFHLTNPDLLLRAVFAIGYVNLLRQDRNMLYADGAASLANHLVSSPADPYT